MNSVSLRDQNQFDILIYFPEVLVLPHTDLIQTIVLSKKFHRIIYIADIFKIVHCLVHQE